MALPTSHKCASHFTGYATSFSGPDSASLGYRARPLQTAATHHYRSTARSRQSRATFCTMAAPVVETAKFTTSGFRRPLHWVFKVGNLKDTLYFYENVFGMHIHRHEEFASGCEATCNGPYGGAWSKTMVGYGTEETNFALELTYNYGISSYKQGNDLRYIAIKKSAVKGDPNTLGLTVDPIDGRMYALSPDGYRYLLVDTAEGPSSEPFLFVSIHVSDLQKAQQFYVDVLGAAIFQGVPGSLGTPNSLVIGFDKSSSGANAVKLELVELPRGTTLDHAEAKGRFATETEDGAEFALAAKLKAIDASRVLHGPIKLQPHGEEVVIVLDADDNEYCFVDARGYTNCINVAYQTLGRTVDWSYRQQLEEAALRNDKQQIAKLLGGDYDVAKTREFISEALSSNSVVVFSQTSCPYCMKAKNLLQEVGATYKVVELDTLGAAGQAIRAELGVSTGRSTVPNVFIAGQSVGGFSDGPGVETLHAEGRLVELLQKAGAL